MIQILHNPKCQKSREGITLLEQSGEPFEVIKYLESTPSFEELKQIIEKLGIAPIDLIRQKEVLWKENFSTQTFNNDELIQLMVAHPKLIERPIVINGNKAIIGRPVEKIITII